MFRLHIECRKGDVANEDFATTCTSYTESLLRSSYLQVFGIHLFTSSIHQACVEAAIAYTIEHDVNSDQTMNPYGIERDPELMGRNILQMLRPLRRRVEDAKKRP